MINVYFEHFVDWSGNQQPILTKPFNKTSFKDRTMIF